ncbi:hypothetical protein ATANTOWER_021593 [Ataeniobius toweri]|uniref:Uncharacterized protein n=1 Tax=Ataeniobius toweri TaxID=208326 RepID=A0ABU7ATQ4_9TELE|nr:hypothetical protein [Ataeniobius toweri]
MSRRGADRPSPTQNKKTVGCLFNGEKETERDLQCGQKVLTVCLCVCVCVCVCVCETTPSGPSSCTDKQWRDFLVFTASRKTQNETSNHKLLESSSDGWMD